MANQKVSFFKYSTYKQYAEQLGKGEAAEFNKESTIVFVEDTNTIYLNGAAYNAGVDVKDVTWDDNTKKLTITKPNKEVTDPAPKPVVIDLSTVFTGAITEVDNVKKKLEALDDRIGKSATGEGSSEVLGIASLDKQGKVPVSQLPSYVDDVIEVDGDLDALRAEYPKVDSGNGKKAETGKIYVTRGDNKTYRWGGTDYIEISQSLAIGDESTTAFAGNRGKALEDKVNILNGNENTEGSVAKKVKTTVEAAKKELGDEITTVKNKQTRLEQSITAAQNMLTWNTDNSKEQTV